MNNFYIRLRNTLLCLLAGVCHPGAAQLAYAQDQPVHRYLYVAAPGVRNYLQYGGHGLLVFDMDNHFKFVRRIATGGLDSTGKPSNVKGVAVSLYTHCIYISTIQAMQCVDLLTEKLLWEKKYDGGCDRMSISPDGKTIYLPSFEGDDWKVVDAKTGDVLHRIVLHSGSHNTVYGQDGKKAYLEGLRSNYLAVVNTADQTTTQAGPFANHIRPFTVNAKQTLCFVNCDSLLGFEIGDLQTGKKIAHVEVKGFQMGPVKRHGCPSHGIGLTPDEKEVWISDAFNESIHIFDIGRQDVSQMGTIKVSDQPGWITFSIDGKYAMPSTGDIIDVKSRKVITHLMDETGAQVQSEKMVEVQLSGKKPVRAGDQFGIGRNPGANDIQPVQRDTIPIAGRWDITVHQPGKEVPSWLEVRHSGSRTLVGRFVGGGGSARPISRVNWMDGKMSFSIPPQWEREDKDLSVEGSLQGDSLVGTMVTSGGKEYQWVGVRAPSLRRNAGPVWGKPVPLFSGADLKGWHALGENQWQAESGILRSPRSGANIATDEVFTDFKLHIEFRYPKGSNSGVYLRGRYEVQIEDSKGMEPLNDQLSAVYGFLSPSEMLAKNAGEWQTYDITLVGRMVTVALNGKTVICNQEIPGITGGALDSKEGEPGPIYLQGDHGPVEFRNIMITRAVRR
ncbi:MAG TPA: family 16 glycoside hydrolase [Puia sp.]|nr:family 16 glycoside hydrolase [Puia sp.]